MTFLPDNGAFSALVRKHAKVEAPLTSLTANDRVIMCPIVRGEIRYGTQSTTRINRDRDFQQIYGLSVSDRTA